MTLEQLVAIRMKNDAKLIEAFLRSLGATNDSKGYTLIYRQMEPPLFMGGRIWVESPDKMIHVLRISDNDRR